MQLIESTTATQSECAYERPEVLATFSQDELAPYLPNERMPHLHAIQNS